MSYPSDVIWYLQARDTDSPESEGSAVAVRLRRLGGTTSPQNFLLTCAHVTRKVVERNKLGPRYKEIRAWRQGDGYNPKAGRIVMPVTDVLPAKEIASTCHYEELVDAVPNADWVLLRFEDQNVANDLELPVVRCVIENSLVVGSECTVHGFPGGSAGFEGHVGAKRNIVTPTQPPERSRIKAADGGMIELSGAFTRAGESGGGLFTSDARGCLIGLHRARADLQLELHGISIRQIMSVLSETYEFVPGTQRKGTLGKLSRFFGSRKTIILSTAAIVLVLLLCWMIKAHFFQSRISAETFYKEWSANPTSLMNRYVGTVMHGKAEVELKNWEASTFYQLKNPLVLVDEKLRRKLGLITLLGDRDAIKPAAGTIAKFEGTIASVTEFLGVELRGVTIEFE